jgi:hypothetical protein
MSRDEQPIVNIRGERVALGPLRRDLVPTYQRWDTDFATNRTTAIARPVTLEQEAAAYDRAAMSEQDVFFTIYDLASWRPIGKTYLESVDLRNRGRSSASSSARRSTGVRDSAPRQPG